MKITSIFKKKSIILLFVFVFCSLSFTCFSQEDEDLAFAALKKAKDYINISQYQNAVNHLNEAIKNGLTNWEIYQTLGLAYIKLRRPSDAINALNKSLELKPDEVETQKALGAVYVNKAKEAQAKGKTADKLDLMLKACHAYPGGTKIWQSLFQAWQSSGESSKIKTEGDFIVKKLKNQISGTYDEALQECLVIVANTYYKEKNIEKADQFAKLANSIRVYSDGLTLLMRDIKQHLDSEAKKVADEAATLYTNKNYDKAIELYRKLSTMPGTKPVDPDEKIEQIEKDKKYDKLTTDINKAIEAQKWGDALDLAEAAIDSFPEDEELEKKYEQIKAKFEEEEAKIERIQKEKDRVKRLKNQFKTEYNDLCNKAKNQINEEKYDDAISSFKKAINKVEEANVHNLLKDVDVSEIQNQIQQLEKKQKDFERDEENYNKLLKEVQKLLEKQNFNEAYDKVKKLSEQYDKRHSMEINQYYAEAAVQTGDFEIAKDRVKKFDLDKKTQIVYNYIYALYYLSEGKNKEGFESLDKVIQENPDFRPGIKNLKYKFYFNKAKPFLYIVLVGIIVLVIKKAIKLIKQAMHNSLIRKVERIREKGDYENHIKFLEEHFQKADLPDMRTVTLLLAGALLKTGNPQRAYELASELLKRESKNPLARKIAGEAAMELNDRSSIALEHIQNLYKLDESRKDIVIYLATAFKDAGSDTRAAQDFINKALTINPADTDMLLYLADVYAKKQTYSAQTAKTLERAVKIAQDDPKYYKALIDNYKKIAEFENADKWLEIARNKFPDNIMFKDVTQQNLFNSNNNYSNPYDSMGSNQQYGSNSYSNKNLNYADSAAMQEQMYSQPQNTPNQPVFGGLNKISGFGSMPDYENISADDNSNSNDDGLPNIFLPPMNESQQDNNSQQQLNIAMPNIPASAPKDNSASSGPQRACPHCGASNSITEYYCNSCGRPLM